MKVYILEENDWDYPRKIVGVYANLEEAEEAKSKNPYYLDVTEYDVIGTLED